MHKHIHQDKHRDKSCTRVHLCSVDRTWMNCLFWTNNSLGVGVGLKRCRTLPTNTDRSFPLLSPLIAIYDNRSTATARYRFVEHGKKAEMHHSSRSVTYGGFVTAMTSDECRYNWRGDFPFQVSFPSAGLISDWSRKEGLVRVCWINLVCAMYHCSLCMDSCSVLSRELSCELQPIRILWKRNKNQEKYE